ncbi:alpha/beta hydrolase [Anaerolineales bacterium]
MTYPLLKLGGATHQPLIHIAIANGFPPETYLPFLRPLFEHYQVLCVPPRALWGGETVPAVQGNWLELKDDFLAAIQEHNLNNIIAIGHSFGAIVSFLAALEAPQYFKSIIALDPTILHPNFLEMNRAAQQQGLQPVEYNPMVPLALKRRAHFDNREQAFEYFQQRSLFKDWESEAYGAYIEYGLETAPGGLQLSWSPAWEAYYFGGVYTEIWSDLEAISQLNLPTLILRGSETDVYIEEVAQSVQALLPRAQHQTIEGHGHLFPQTAPEITTALVLKWLKATGQFCP